jgi:ABC-2 type transport system permease protein
VEVTPNLLADRICSQIAVEQVRQTVFGPMRIRNAVNYPFFPIIQSFDEHHAIVSGLEQARLFFTNEVASSIDSTRRDRTHFQPLLSTSKYTAVLPGPSYNLRHEDNPAFANLNSPGRTVAGLLRGEVTSLFTEETKPEAAEELIPSTPNARILVIGDGSFFSDDAGGSVTENLNLVINAVDFLSGDEELIAIRSREVTARPLKELSAAARSTWKWSNILVPSILMVVMGIWRWRSGRRRRKLLEEAYAK